MNRLHRLNVLIQWFKEYLAVNNYRSRTIEDYMGELSLFSRWLLEQTKVEDMDEPKLFIRWDGLVQPKGDKKAFNKYYVILL